MSPLGQSGGSAILEGLPVDEGAFQIEVFLDRAKQCGEFLQNLYPPKVAYRSFTSSEISDGSQLTPPDFCRRDRPAPVPSEPNRIRFDVDPPHVSLNGEAPCSASAFGLEPRPKSAASDQDRRMHGWSTRHRTASDQNATRARPVARRPRAAKLTRLQQAAKYNVFGAPGTIRTSDPQIRSRLKQIQNKIFISLFLLAFSRTSLRRLNSVVAFGACRRPGGTEDDDDTHPPRDVSATSRFRRPQRICDGAAPLGGTASARRAGPSPLGRGPVCTPIDSSA